jgi:hypothetical protein
VLEIPASNSSEIRPVIISIYGELPSGSVGRISLIYVKQDQSSYQGSGVFEYTQSVSSQYEYLPPSVTIN